MKAYCEVLAAPEDIPKTVILLFVLNGFVRLLFELKNDVQAFHHLIAEYFRSFGFVFAYLNDIFVAIATETEQLQYLDESFRSLSIHGISINSSKPFGVTSPDFLGVLIELRWSQCHRKCLSPCKDCTGFWNSSCFYHLVPNRISILQTLTALLCANSRNSMLRTNDLENDHYVMSDLSSNWLLLKQRCGHLRRIPLPVQVTWIRVVGEFQQRWYLTQ